MVRCLGCVEKATWAPGPPQPGLEELGMGLQETGEAGTVLKGTQTEIRLDGMNIKYAD